MADRLPVGTKRIWAGFPPDPPRPAGPPPTPKELARALRRRIKSATKVPQPIHGAGAELAAGRSSSARYRGGGGAALLQPRNMADVPSSVALIVMLRGWGIACLTNS